MSKLYISGPMSGIVEHNFPAFVEAASKYRDRGYEVVSPHEIEDINGDWGTCLRDDLKQMLDCDTIVMLAGWSNSRGATFELFVATQIGMNVMIDE